MNLLQKAITIKKLKNGKNNDLNEETALKNGSETFKATIESLIKLIEGCSQKVQDKYLPHAKLLLDALKNEQAFTDKQIKKALDYIFDIAFDIWWNNDCDADGEKIMNELDEVADCIGYFETKK